MASPATPLPPVVFEDGLGQRRRVVGARNQTLSVLFLDGELTAAPAFEAALRERIAQFAAFHHESFARARGVVHLSKVPPRLALASDFVDGVRLSEMLTIAEQRLIPLEINAAFGVIRQLVPALAALHEQAPDAYHGALSPERVIVTSDGRVVIVEHVLGAALDSLHFSPQRYWKELRIPVSPNGGAPQFDRRADVAQLGAMALALIVGRPLREDEYPARVSEIVDGVRAISSTGLEQLPAGVHAWLRRALQLEARRSFESAIDAHAELDGIYNIGDVAARSALRTFVEHCLAALPGEPEPLAEPIAMVVPAVAERRPELRVVRPAEPVAPEEPAVAAAAPEPEAAEPEPFFPSERDLETHAEHEVTTAPIARHVEPLVSIVEHGEPVTAVLNHKEPDAPIVEHGELAEPVVAAAAAPIMPVETADATPPPQPPPYGGASSFLHAADDVTPDAGIETSSAASRLPAMMRDRRLQIAAAVGLFVVASAAMLVAGYVGARPVGTLVVNTNPSGAIVMIDGKDRGSSPLTIELAPGKHALQVVGIDGQVRALPVVVTEGRELAQFIELPTVTTAPDRGQLQVRTEPAGARVTIDGQFRGVSPLTVEGLTPGPHGVELQDGTETVTERVTIEAGMTASLVVPLGAPRGVPVSGWISVAAPVDVQVFEHQQLLGSSRSSQIMVAAGPHELEIVNETLGYRTTRTVQVKPGDTARITLDWPKGALALNAVPWAEAWLDGERLGETPIGNVSLPIGVHRVVFRHPELGEQTHDVTVTLLAPARVSADMRKR